MMDNNRRIGKLGEKLAEEYFVNQGMEILERNYYTPSGEIDLIARDKNVTIFIEVKTRTGKQYGYPEEAVTHKKRISLLESAEYYLMEHPDMDDNLRFDVISIEMRKDGENPVLTWFENAFT